MKAPSRSSLLCLWTAAILVALTINGFAQSFTPPPPPQQLSAGQKAGTFAFSYSGQVGFTQDPAFPVTVSITDAVRKPVVQIVVKDDSPFTVSADLAPGSYEINSDVMSEKSKVYWVALGPRFFIDQKGLVTFTLGNGSLLHQKMMTVLSPDPKGTETVAEARPLLKWQPLPSAVRYNVFWSVHEPSGKIDRDKNGSSEDITTTEYRLPEDVIPNRRYEWSVWAWDSDNKRIGYWSAAYFFTLGGKEACQKDEPKISFKVGAPYLGIMPMPTVPGFGPKGIGVISVLPDSPALKAGLLPNDVLTSFNGHSLEDASIPEFIHLVQEVPVGKQVTIEFLRYGVKGAKNSAQVTIEAKP